MHSTFFSAHKGTWQISTHNHLVSMQFSQYRNLSISAFCKNVNKAARKNLSNILISGHIKTSSTYVFIWRNVTVQPLHLLVFIFMKTRSLVVPPYADLDEKVLMQASLQHTFSFKPAHGWTVTEKYRNCEKMLDNARTVCYSFIVCRTVRFSRIPWWKTP